MDSCLLKDLGRDTRLAPGRVVDPLTPSVIGGNRDEGLLELGQVVLGLAARSLDTPLEIASLLDQMHALECVGGGELGLELIEACFQGVGARRAPSARLGPLQSDKIPADCISLAATFGKRVFVGRGKTRLGWLLSWWHTTSIAHNDPSIPMLLCGASRRSLFGIAA